MAGVWEQYQETAGCSVVVCVWCPPSGSVCPPAAPVEEQAGSWGWVSAQPALRCLGAPKRKTNEAFWGKLI